MTPTRPRPLTLLARAARLRCPYGGRGTMLRGWFALVPRGTVCGLSFERDEREDYWGGVAQMIVTPIVFYPFSKTLWLAGNLIFRPPNDADFEPHSMT